ncbi:MAG: YhbY family RNA-binding protein [Planctomycetota bacterium]
MPLTGRQRRDLLARSHTLRPAVIVAFADPLPEAVIAQVRTALAAHELVKVRVNADTGAEADAVAAQLASRAACELVRRVGKVIVLYKPAEPEASP